MEFVTKKKILKPMRLRTTVKCTVLKWNFKNCILIAKLKKGISILVTARMSCTGKLQNSAWFF